MASQIGGGAQVSRRQQEQSLEDCYGLVEKSILRETGQMGTRLFIQDSHTRLNGFPAIRTSARIPEAFRNFFHRGNQLFLI